MKRLLPLGATLLAACATPTFSPRAAPFVDYHQHLVSADFAPIVKLPQRHGAALVTELDAAGIDRAVVLSMGYTFADDRKKLSDPDGKTASENNWTSAQVTKNAPRLVGFCSANPLCDAAVQELGRCLSLPGMVGIKQHFGNSGVSLRNPDHLRRIQELFRLAEKRHAPVLIHFRARGGDDFGAEDAQLLIDKVLPFAPSVDVIIAHLGATSPGYLEQNDEVMAVLSAARLRHDPRVRRLYVDTAANIGDDTTPAQAALAAKRIRDFGVTHILYGSDLTPPGGSIATGWQTFRMKMPLTPAELQAIIDNRLPFVR